MASRFDAVLFDYGHTLVDLQRPEPHLLEAYHQINQRLERELEREIPEAADLLVAVSENVDNAIGRSYRSGAEQEVDIADLYRTALRRIGINCLEETLEWVIDQEQVAWFSGIVPSPHARAVLTRLRQRGKRTVIVSNAAFPPRSMRDQLRHIEFIDLFDATVYSSEFGVRKPNPAIYQEALRLAGVAAERALFIGDRMREDVRGPRSVGMEAVLTHEFRQEPPGADVEVEVVRDLRGLEALVDD
jgi:putative hydrolase of the HAD superfamily